MVTTAHLVDLLQDSGAYFSSRMCPPPAEKYSRVIQFEMTTGCSYNACEYCIMYRGEKYRQKTLDEYCDHVDRVWDALKRNHKDSIPELRRIFIGGGDALSVDEDTLLKGIRYSVASFKRNVGKLPRRVAVYGSTRNLAQKTDQELRKLNCGGVCGACSIDQFGEKLSLGLLYWGLESGSAEVLAHARKGCTESDLYKAVANVRNSGIRLSLMVMPGLGGIKHYKSHVAETANLINRLKPKFVTFIGLKLEPHTPYENRFRDEEASGENRRLTPREIALQTVDMIEALKVKTTIGIHGDDIHTFGHNPLTLGTLNVEIEHNFIMGYSFKPNTEKRLKKLRREAEKVIVN